MINEVNKMEEKDLENQIPEEAEKPSYTPRPKWQVWGARILLVLFVILVILYYINVARGGI